MEKPNGSLISYFSRLVTRKGGINLAQGKPGFPPPERLLDILEEKNKHPFFHQYAPGIGNFKLLTLLSEAYYHYTPIQEDNLLITQGATEAIFLTFFYLDKILPRPYSVLSIDPDYESYPRLANILDTPIEYIDYNEDLTIDFSAVERIVKEKNVKIMFIASPGNPLGKIWSETELANIVSLAKTYDFYIIFDGVYKDIYFDAPPSIPLSALPSGRLFYIDSFSKMLSITGWRIGYLITSQNHIKAIRDIHDYTGLSAPSLLQEAIAEYLESQNFGATYTKWVRTSTKETYLFMKQSLDKLGFTVPNIGGGYFIWARLPASSRFQDGFQFANELLNQTGLAVVPGENFSKTKTNYIRLNIACDLQVIREAATKLHQFMS